MLNKDVCKKCWIEHRKKHGMTDMMWNVPITKEAWIEQFDKRWNNGLTRCKMSKWHTRLDEITEVPQGCDYKLEHTVMRDETE